MSNQIKPFDKLCHLSHIPGRCVTCGAAVERLHMPMHKNGWFCEAHCPACGQVKDATEARIRRYQVRHDTLGFRATHTATESDYTNGAGRSRNRHAPLSCMRKQAVVDRHRVSEPASHGPTASTAGNAGSGLSVRGTNMRSLRTHATIQPLRARTCSCTGNAATRCLKWTKTLSLQVLVEKGILRLEHLSLSATYQGVSRCTP